MKSKTSLAKKLLAILLSLLMAVGVATPAFAMDDDNEFGWGYVNSRVYKETEGFRNRIQQ